jgi:hypothetical protein
VADAVHFLEIGQASGVDVYGGDQLESATELIDGSGVGLGNSAGAYDCGPHSKLKTFSASVPRRDATRLLARAFGLLPVWHAIDDCLDRAHIGGNGVQNTRARLVCARSEAGWRGLLQPEGGHLHGFGFGPDQMGQRLEKTRRRA